MHPFGESCGETLRGSQCCYFLISVSLKRGFVIWFVLVRWLVRWFVCWLLDCFVQFLPAWIVQLRCSGSRFVNSVGARVAKRKALSICDVGPYRVFVSFSCCRFAHDRFGAGA